MSENENTANDGATAETVQQPSMITFNTTAPEPQQVQQPTPNAYQAIIDQQQQQIEALIAQTNAQSAQIAQMVQNGAQFSQAPAQQVQQIQQPAYAPQQFAPQPSPMQQFAPPSLADDRDWSLEGLAELIGKAE